MSALREAKDLFKIALVANQLQKETGQTCSSIQNQDGESGKPPTDDTDIICYQQAAYSLSSPLRNNFSSKTAFLFQITNHL